MSTHVILPEDTFKKMHGGRNLSGGAEKARSRKMCVHVCALKCMCAHADQELGSTAYEKHRAQDL